LPSQAGARGSRGALQRAGFDPQPSVDGASCPAGRSAGRNLYNQATGLLSYDVNGNIIGGAIAFAVLSNKPALAANDFQVI
jgi:hypothetical protein